jgi:hypothetical protein
MKYESFQQKMIIFLNYQGNQRNIFGKLIAVKM